MDYNRAVRRSAGYVLLLVVLTLVGAKLGELAWRQVFRAFGYPPYAWTVNPPAARLLLNAILLGASLFLGGVSFAALFRYRRTRIRAWGSCWFDVLRVCLLSIGLAVALGVGVAAAADVAGPLLFR